MAAKLRHYGMGLLLDIVPNHMAASYENPWWIDVLENGPSSAYAIYFDIDWHPATTKAAFLQENRVLLPILGELYGDVLAPASFALKFEDTGIQVRYYDTRLPLDPKTYTAVLTRGAGQSSRKWLRCSPTSTACRTRDESDQDRIVERRREKDRIKERLWRAYQDPTPEVKHAIDDALAVLHRVGGRSRPAALRAGLPPGLLEDRLRGDQLPPFFRYQRAGRAAHRVARSLRQPQPEDVRTGAQR